MKRIASSVIGWVVLITPLYAGTLLQPSSCVDIPKVSVIVGKPAERLYLFPAYPPECNLSDSQECRASGYIITHDVVSVHASCGAWTYITFTNKKLQRSAGWVDSKRISSSPLVPIAELSEQAHDTMVETQKEAQKLPGSRNVDICAKVADYANRDVLDRFRVPKGTWLDQERIAKIFGEDASILGGGEYWHIDLNGDGIPEHLMMSSQGTAHIGYGYVLSEKKGSSTQDIPSNEEDISLIEIGKNYLFTFSVNGELLGISRFRIDGAFQSICTFSQRPQPTINVIFGRQNPVCKSVAAGNVSFVDFPQKPYEKMKSLGSLSDGHTTPILANDAVKLDIDNDGRKEDVTRLSYMRPGGRGCNWTQLVTTDSAGTAVPDNSLNQLLLDFLGGSMMCGSDMNTFVHSGRVYIDVQVKGADRSIYQVSSNKVETVCKFVRHTVTEVANRGNDPQ